jgi:hypothetical protein
MEKEIVRKFAIDKKIVNFPRILKLIEILQYKKIRKKSPNELVKFNN